MTASVSVESRLRRWDAPPAGRRRTLTSSVKPHKSLSSYFAQLQQSHAVRQPKEFPNV